MVKTVKKAKTANKRSVKLDDDLPSAVTPSNATTSSKSSKSSLPNTLVSTPIRSLDDLSDQMTEILTTAYGISVDRSLLLRTEILSWDVDANSFESKAQTFIKTLAQPKERNHIEAPGDFTPSNALRVVFDQQQIMDYSDIEHCWRTVAAGLVLTSSGRLYGNETPRSAEELRSWLAQTHLNLDSALHSLGVDPRDECVLNLTYQVLELLLKWEHLVHSVNGHDIIKIAFALKYHLDGRRINPKEYWSRRRLTYDLGKPCHP